MEMGGEKKQIFQDDKHSRRKMKTPTQLETLEKVYAEEQYPSEAVRAELTARIGLSDKQLKLWFCHRRLKDRKVKEDESPLNIKKQKRDKGGALKENSGAVLASELMDPALTGGNYYDNNYTTTLRSFGQEDAAGHIRKQVVKRSGKENENALRRKSQQDFFKGMDPHRAAEVRAVSAVEAQLGEPLREDSPMLGVEFDGLPLGAFDTFMAHLQSHGTMRTAPQCDNKSSERHEMKARKNAKEDQYPSTGSGHRKAMLSSSFEFDDRPGPRALQEYKFIPEQPTGRPEISQPRDKSTQSKFYLGADNPFQSLASAGSFLHGSDALMSAFSFQGGLSTVGGGLLPQIDGCASRLFPPSGLDFEGLHQDAFPGFGYDNQFAAHRASLQLLSGGGSYPGSEKLTLLHEQEQTKMEKKRKNEEARIAKEVEAHEKRIRREIERQDIARKKREEQLRKDLEKQDREKRREEERAIRDRQREDERIQREHQREVERRERIMEKETKRVERQLQKDESRRQKEVAKLKVASERAIARRLARESTDLIDDERLELLEAAAFSQGLPSIYLLDGETLNELEKYQETLKKFPPVSVQTKKPLTVHPWSDSRVNFGNLLMVWRFLTTFADVLGLWPFTLDELVQAFHDYDPRLLGEINIALLKMLVKDIVDVAQTSSAGMTVNQYCVGSTGGGHPFLIEAAHSWGFDIREWRQHLNPLSWPEILRQFALSAGYGPKWKKHAIEVDRSHDENEGKEGEDIVTSLRSGVAVANAASQMRGKGGRRRRHRLTPGTVKFAAFYVLSVEGASGLTILEVAERIQKSGLRDLSTSKTPEASIAAALSRDAKLFERVAPSTYCVRAAFRKDPEDAENILQTAREKVQLFQNGSTGIEDGEKETEFADEPEREEDTDEDVEDGEGDETEGALAEGKPNSCTKNGEDIQSGLIISDEKEQLAEDMNSPLMVSHLTHYIEKINIDVISEILDVNNPGNSGEDVAALDDDPLVSAFPEETEIDESHVGEPWVQGLMEGDYCDLSVEERLNALVALVDVVNEGNTVRVALEERLEAANSIKKQMWAEAQLDRRRFKEEQLLKLQLQSDEGFKSEATNNNIKGLHESPFDEIEKCSEAMESKGELILDTVVAQADPGSDLAGAEKIVSMQGGPFSQEMSMGLQAGYAADKSRAQLKADIGLRAEELYVYRSLPLGFDRRHNRYWQFVACNNGQDPGCGRLYLESSEDAQWHVIDTKEAFDALMASLDTRGTREAHLHGILQKSETIMKEAMQKASNCSSVVAERQTNFGQIQVEHFRNGEFANNSGYASEEGSSVGGVIAPGGDLRRETGAILIECGSNQAERESVLERYLDFDRWIWTSCVKGTSCLNALKFGKKRCSDVLNNCEICHDLYWPRDKHCSYCHATIEGPVKIEAKFAQHLLECDEKHRKKESNWRVQSTPRWLPSRIQLLKAEVLAVEVSIPLEALKPVWTDSRRKAWASTLKNASSSGELFQLMTALEGVVYRDWLSPSYETTEELLSNDSKDSNSLPDLPGMGAYAVLPWVPQTTAAVALRLMVFDAALSYSLEQKQVKLKQLDDKDLTETAVQVGMQVGSVPATVKLQEVEAEDESSSEEEGKGDESIDASIQSSGRGRGRGGCLRGRGRGRGSSSRSLAVSEVRTGSKGKLKSSEEAAVDDQQIEKVGRGRRGRGGRGRGRGRSRSRGGRGRGRGSIKRGRGQGSRSGRGRQSFVVKRGRKSANMSISTQRKKKTSKQVAEQEQQQSEEYSTQNAEWEVQAFEENDEEPLDNEGGEENATDYSEEQEDDADPDQEEERMLDDDDDDDERQYEAAGYSKQGYTEDSVDEDQAEGGSIGGEEDEEEGENDEDLQSGTSEESE